jgi:hypothetical protein
MRIFIGVDPGEKGAIAMLIGDGTQVVPMPTREPDGIEPDEETSRRWPDEAKIGLYLRRAIYHAAGDPQRVVIAVEYAGPMPFLHGGANAEHYRGAWPWGWRYAAAALKIPRPVFVRPQSWQAVMLGKVDLPRAVVPVGSTEAQAAKLKRAASAHRRAVLKASSVNAARRLFPGVELHTSERSRVESDGMAEALLIAEWGRRRFFGGAVFSRVPA